LAFGSTEKHIFVCVVGERKVNVDKSRVEVVPALLVRNLQNKRPFIDLQSSLKTIAERKKMYFSSKDALVYERKDGWMNLLSKAGGALRFFK
jgi:hypothetical protein